MSDLRDKITAAIGGNATLERGVDSVMAVIAPLVEDGKRLDWALPYLRDNAVIPFDVDGRAAIDWAIDWAIEGKRVLADDADIADEAD